MFRRSHSRGFSLLELVAVVTLLGIVAAVVMLRLNQTDTGTAKTNVNKQNVTIMQAAVERYFFEKGSYPADLNALVTDGYLPTVPTPPGGVGTYSVNATTGMVSFSAGS